MLKPLTGEMNDSENPVTNQWSAGFHRGDPPQVQSCFGSMSGTYTVLGRWF